MKAKRFDMEAMVGRVLQLGVLASCALTAAGLVWHVLATGRASLEYSITGVDLYGFILEDARQVAAGVVRSRLLINLGILTLLLTPYVRVLASFLYFALAERNWKYTVFTGFVLGVLTYSLFLR
jgi:uncharacterized membrane protein